MRKKPLEPVFCVYQDTGIGLGFFPELLEQYNFPQKINPITLSP